MALSRTRIERLEKKIRPPKVYITLVELMSEISKHGHVLPGHELYPEAEAIVQQILGPAYLRNALQVHQAMPEDLAALGLEGRDESSLTLGEMCHLLNHKLGRPLDTTIEQDELKAIDRERYEPADPEGEEDDDAEPRFYFQRPHKPGFPRSIFQSRE